MLSGPLKLRDRVPSESAPQIGHADAASSDDELGAVGVGAGGSAVGAVVRDGDGDGGDDGPRDADEDTDGDGEAVDTGGGGTGLPPEASWAKA